MPGAIQTALDSLDAAVYARWKTDLAPTEVYKFVPENAAYPYVIIGSVSVEYNGSSTHHGEIFTYTGEIWTQGTGRKALVDLVKTLIESTTRAELDMSTEDYKMIRQLYEGYDVLPLLHPTGPVQQALVRFLFEVRQYL